MTGLTVDPGRRRLLRAGVVHVPLLDTVWNAFAEPSPDEWSDYLQRRRSQGFTGLLISLLPTLHDRSENDGSRMPFPTTADGRLIPGAIDLSYLEHARRMAEEAVDAGFTIFLVVLWSNYLPGSAASNMAPAVTLPDVVRHELPGLVAEYFADLDPVLVISGDDPFTAPFAVEAYGELLRACATAMPTLLRTFHMWPDAVLPLELLNDPALDISTLQSGHTADEGAKAIEIATRAVGESVRPIVNLEPCYEGHGHVRGHGRFSAAEVRRVAWTSLTAGASAGLGYGAHGVWQWHRTGSRFANANFSGTPYPWSTAMGLAGADDVSFARTIWEGEALAGAIPDQGVLDRDDDGARAARGDERTVAIYLPSPRPIRLALDPSAVRAWDLAARRPLVPRIRPEGDGVLVEAPDVVGDCILILEN